MPLCGRLFKSIKIEAALNLKKIVQTTFKKNHL